jgi:hypothetical protein
MKTKNHFASSATMLQISNILLILHVLIKKNVAYSFTFYSFADDTNIFYADDHFTHLSSNYL